jgi:mono/diheme cytochrome c family protein
MPCRQAARESRYDSAMVRPGFLAFAAVALALLPLVSAAACPENRTTKKAPDDFYNRANPLAAGALDKKAAEVAFFGDGQGIACASCHGVRGDGKGDMASMFDPAPRDFRCKATLASVSDGQLFWVIKFGSPTTSMPPHPHLSDSRIWQLVLYIRALGS